MQNVLPVCFCLVFFVCNFGSHAPRREIGGMPGSGLWFLCRVPSGRLLNFFLS